MLSQQPPGRAAANEPGGLPTRSGYTLRLTARLKEPSTFVLRREKSPNSEFLLLPDVWQVVEFVDALAGESKAMSE